jgi:hypothetical protein
MATLYESQWVITNLPVTHWVAIIHGALWKVSQDSGSYSVSYFKWKILYQYGSKSLSVLSYRLFQQITPIKPETVDSAGPCMHTHQLAGSLCSVVVERSSFFLCLFVKRPSPVVKEASRGFTNDYADSRFGWRIVVWIGGCGTRHHLS